MPCARAKLAARTTTRRAQRQSKARPCAGASGSSAFPLLRRHYAEMLCSDCGFLHNGVSVYTAAAPYRPRCAASSLAAATLEAIYQGLSGAQGLASNGAQLAQLSNVIGGCLGV